MRKQVAIYGIIGIAMLALWFYLVYAPNRRAIEETRHQTAEAQQRLADYNRILAQIPHFVSTSRDLEAARTDIVDRLYAKQEILKLFEELTAKAGQKNLSITEIRPSVEDLLKLNAMRSRTSEPLFINIVLRFRGDYIQFGKFVQQLESEPYFRGINVCHIIPAEGNNQPLHMLLGFKALLGNLEAS